MKAHAQAIVGMLAATVFTTVCVFADCWKAADFGNNIWGTVPGMPCWINCTYSISVCMNGGNALSCNESTLVNYCARGTTNPGEGGLTTCDGPYTWENKNTTWATQYGECSSNPPGGET